MGEKIALGFHTCVDFEMTWDAEVVEQMIREFTSGMPILQTAIFRLTRCGRFSYPACGI